MMRLVVRRKYFFEELGKIELYLRKAKETTTDTSRRWRLAKLLNETQELIEESQHYYEEPSSSFRVGAKIEKQARELSRSTSEPAETLTSLAFSTARALESAKTEGFEIPQGIQGMLQKLADGILKCLHETKD